MLAVRLNPTLFSLPSHEISQIGTENLTQGSLKPKGIQSMCNTLCRLMKSTETIHGFDLGCGDGELVQHLQNELPGAVWEGVEISEHRVNQQTRDVNIWQGDMLAENFRPQNVLHADNLCLQDSIAEALEEKIAREFKGIQISQRTPEAFLFQKKARLLCSVPTETTWNTHTIHQQAVN